MCDMVKTNLTQWPIVLVCENVVNIVMLRTTSTVFQKAGHACRAVRLGGTNGGGMETQFWDQFKRSILHVLTRFFWRPPVTTFVLRDPVTSFVLWPPENHIMKNTIKMHTSCFLTMWRDLCDLRGMAVSLFQCNSATHKAKLMTLKGCILGWPWFGWAASQLSAGGMGASCDITSENPTHIRPLPAFPTKL